MSEKVEAERLLDELLPFAKHMLEEHGEFHPFAGYIKKNGDIVHVGVDLPGPATGKEKFSAIVKWFQETTRSSPIAVAGIATNHAVCTPKDGAVDSIRLFVEHSNGYCAEVYHLYRIVEGKPVYLRVTAQRGEGVLFRRVN